MNALVTKPAQASSCLISAVDAEHSLTLSEFNEATDADIGCSSFVFAHPSVNLVTLSDVTVGGLGLIEKDGDLLLPDNVFPRYLKSSLEKYLRYSSQERAASGARVWFGALLNEQKQRLHLEKAAFCFHPNLVYGHFLTEILPKVLALDAFLPKDILLVIPSSGPVWVQELVKQAAPERPLFLYDHRTHVVTVAHLCLIENLFDGLLFHPRVPTLIDTLVERLLNTHNPDKSHAPCAERKLLYVSRVAVSKTWHKLLDEHLIEEVFEAEGFTIIRPETMSFAQQVALFSRSSILVGEYSSAMHNAMFADSATHVICLNRINSYQDAIARMKNQTVAFITGQDGNFLTWRDQTSQRQHISFDCEKLRIIARASAQLQAIHY